MNRDRLQAEICEALENCITANGVNVLDKFTPIEVADFANTITAFVIERTIDSNINSIINILEEEVEEVSTSSTLRVFFYNNYLGGNNKEASKIDLLKVIVSLLKLYTIKSETSIEEDIEDYTNFALSFIIPDMKTLQEEIINNKTNAVTKKIEGGYIRVKSDGSYVPTTQTKLNFNKYL